MNNSKTEGTRGWPSCLVDSKKLEILLANRNRSFRWLWTGDGPGRIDTKTGIRVEQGKPTSARTIFKIATRLGCDPLELVSDSDAKAIIETARGRIEITDREGLWGGNPGRGYLSEDWPIRNGIHNIHPSEFDFSPDDHHKVSHKNFISVDHYDPKETIEMLALDWVEVKTIATKSSAYDLTSLSARHARVPICDPSIQQNISLDIEPLVHVHEDVETHKNMTKTLGELFDRFPKASDTQRTIPTISELETHENNRSEIHEILKILANQNIQILDTHLSTDLVLNFNNDQEVFASFARPLLVIASSALIDVEVIYPQLSLGFGLQPQ